MLPSDPTGWAFVKPDGKCIDQEYIRRKLKIVKAVGIKHATPNAFRHTFATRLVHRDVPLRVLQKLLGHAKIEMTLVYSHVPEDEKFRAVEKLVEG